MTLDRYAFSNISKSRAIAKISTLSLSYFSFFLYIGEWPTYLFRYSGSFKVFLMNSASSIDKNDTDVALPYFVTSNLLFADTFINSRSSISSTAIFKETGTSMFL